MMAPRSRRSSVFFNSASRRSKKSWPPAKAAVESTARSMSGSTPLRFSSQPRARRRASAWSAASSPSRATNGTRLARSRRVSASSSGLADQPSSAARVPNVLRMKAS